MSKIKLQKTRDEIISRGAVWTNDVEIFQEPHYGCGIAHFSRMNVETMQILLDKGFATKQDKQNNAPTYGKILKFLKENPGFTANGYAVEMARNDHRVTVTGVEFHGKYTKKDLENFKNFSSGSDEYSINKEHLRCWWD